MRQSVDANVAIIACRSDGAYHREPQNNELDEIICPDDARLEYLAEHDLRDTNENHRPEQCDERNIFDEAPEPIQLRQ